jgi:hypothetical protein
VAELLPFPRFIKSAKAMTTNCLAQRFRIRTLMQCDLKITRNRHKLTGFKVDALS